MSIIRADSIKNRAGNGAPDFPNGITVTGIVTSTVLDASVANLTVTGNLGVGGTVTYEDVTNVDSIGVGTFRDGLRVTGICTATAFHGNGSALTGIDATALKDGSGNVIVQASSLDVVVSAGKTFKPATTNSTDLGTTNERWRVIYTNDLELSNKGSQNSVDGTWGDWTLQEGENDIFMINNRTNKKFKINMTEVE
tara:strand:+ start:1704 stop:2291 length:588 start_codon:yes stop_codon:yes gene_type:complete